MRRMTFGVIVTLDQAKRKPGMGLTLKFAGGSLPARVCGPGPSGRIVQEGVDRFQQLFAVERF
jgi:hypothetical protein